MNKAQKWQSPPQFKKVREKRESSQPAKPQ